MKNLLIVPALAALAVLAACSDVRNSGSGMAMRSDVGVSGPRTGWTDANQASAYRQELRAENSN